MSRVYFTSEHGEAELRGSERAHCGVTCSAIAWALLGVHFHNDPIKSLIAETDAIRPDYFVMDAQTRFNIGNLGFILPDGRKADAFHVALNTVIAAGDDVLRLMARLHGQCEVHGYVEAENRPWLADLIARGRREHILRDNQGWDEVVAFLLSSGDGPVVTSYSVCETFPNPSIAGIEDEAEREQWYDKSTTEKWAECMNAIRNDSAALREWRPDNWSSVGFGEGITAMELRAIADSLLPLVT